MAEFWFYDHQVADHAKLPSQGQALVWHYLPRSRGASTYTGQWVQQWPDHRLTVSAPLVPFDDDEVNEIAIQFLWDHQRIAILKQDHWIPELVRYLRLQDVRMIVAPFLANHQQFGPLWRDAQQNQVMAIAMFPLQLLVPCEATNDATGYRNAELVSPGVWRVHWLWSELSEAESKFAILPHWRQDIYQKHAWWPKEHLHL